MSLSYFYFKLSSCYIRRIKYFYKSMTEISKIDHSFQCFHQQVIEQQQTLISVLKQEIMRLQVVIIDLEKERDEKHHKYELALQQIQLLKQKMESLKENNDSIMQTFKVFQRQFVKRDYNLALISPRKYKDQASDAPLFMQLIRNMKLKFQQEECERTPTNEKSFLSEHYGFFFQQQLQTDQAELYNETTKAGKLKPNKIRSFGKKHYFNQKYRFHFWFNALNNNLKISHKLYQLLLDKYDSNRQNETRKNTIIDLDLKRMDLKIDEDKSESMKVQLKKCLQIFKLYRPDIGYVQGMSYIAWMLLIRMEGYESFVCFSNLVLTDPFIQSLYLFKGENIKKIICFYGECLKDKKPKLARHMKNLMVEPQLFLIEWAYTMFSRAFNLRISSKIWDLWFSEGHNAFFKATMTIMQMLESEILEQKENDKIIELIRTKTHKLDEIQFLKLLHKQKLFEDLKF